MTAEGRIAFLLQVRNDTAAGLRAAMGQIQNFFSWMRGQKQHESWDKLSDSLLKVAKVMAAIRAAAGAMEAVAAAQRGDWEAISQALRSIPVFGPAYHLGEAIKVVATGGKRPEDIRREAEEQAAESMRRNREYLAARASMSNMTRAARRAVEDARASESAKARLAIEREREDDEARIATGERHGIGGAEARSAVEDEYKAKLEAQAFKERLAVQEAWRDFSKYLRGLGKDYTDMVKETKERMEEIREGLRDMDRQRKEDQDEFESESRRRMEEYTIERRAEFANAERERFDALHQSAPLVELTNSFKGFATTQIVDQRFKAQVLRDLDDIRRNAFRDKDGGGVAIVLR